MKLGTIALIFAVLLVIAYMPDQCGKYESPAKSTALYEYRVGGFFGHTYYTNDYEIHGEVVTVHGWWDKYHDESGNGTIQYPIEHVDYIETNPSLNNNSRTAE